LIFEGVGKSGSSPWWAFRVANFPQFVSDGLFWLIGLEHSWCIGEHLQKNISEAYNGLDVSFDEYPKEGKTDPDAYKTAIDALPKGSASKW
jgi:hypothetical protein